MNRRLNNSGYVMIGPLQMYYETHGKGEPLLLLHGGGSGINATFGRILSELARTHRVIAIEQQGHGHTADIDRPFSLEQMADDTAKLLAKLDIECADIFGFSNGGQVALFLAIRHPQLVKKLILASTFFDIKGVIPELPAAWARQLTIADMPRGLSDEFMRIAPLPKDLQNHINKSQEMMRHFKNIPIRELKQLMMPTLIINGDRDVVRLEHAVEMMHLIPNARMSVLPGSHGAYIGELSTPVIKTDLPQLTVTLIDEFLEGFQL